VIESAATNLRGYEGPIDDDDVVHLYVYDRDADALRRITGPDGGHVNAVSQDACVVLFQNGTGEVWRYDCGSDTGKRVTDYAIGATLSRDGMTAGLSTLGDLDEAQGTGAAYEVLVVDLVSGGVDRLAATPSGDAALGYTANAPALSSNGTVVAFEGVDGSGVQHVLVREETDADPTSISCQIAGIWDSAPCSPPRGLARALHRAQRGAVQTLSDPNSVRRNARKVLRALVTARRTARRSGRHSEEAATCAAIWIEGVNAVRREVKALRHRR
jgi:hypothetical protein